ncbi:MAG: branched-chain amino acid ABC transporter permease [Thaumarchaeota archaeon]|nr:branched-chain amino acid ABC transporter permease [Nitrososphaerota archaeon]
MGSIPTFTVSCGTTHIDLVSVFVNVGIIFCIYLVVSLTVNLEFGYTGIPNFGKVLFVAVGGLMAGTLSYRLALYVLNLQSTDVIANQAIFNSSISKYIVSHPYFGVELFLFSLIVGGGLAALIGYLASFPAIRLKEDYLGMLLLAAGQFFLIFVTAYYPITGGTQGLLIPDPVNWAVSTKDLRDIVVLGILILVAVAVYLYSERVARSPLGRMMRAVRDNEISSEAIGKNTIGIRRNVLIIASALSGVAGVLYVLWSPAISPGTFLRTEWTFYPFVIVILGGAANNLGVGVGTAVFVGITTIIDQARTCILGNGISLPIDINAIEPIAIGILLLVVLLWRPKGLVQEKPSSTIRKSRLKNIFEKANKVLSQERAQLPRQSTDADDETVMKSDDDG